MAEPEQSGETPAAADATPGRGTSMTLLERREIEAKVIGPPLAVPPGEGGDCAHSKNL